jgi:tripartite-type tricarboxylate transporter receptor subunit TctC
MNLRSSTVRRRILKGLAGAAGIVAAGKLFAQSGKYPDRPVKLVVPYQGGGSVELFVRPLAAQLAQRFGQQVFIEYKPGANSQIGAGYAAKSPPDGYTILFATDAAMSIAPALAPSLPYDARSDFTPLSVISHLPLLLVVHPDTGFRTVADIVAKARAQPGTVSHGTLGVGSIAHVGMEIFAQQAGIELLHVPFQGSGPVVTSLLGGNINGALLSIGASLVHARAGKMRPIALAAARRSPVWPDVPTFAESGFPDFEVRGWFGMFAPRGLPEPVAQTLTREMWSIISSKDFIENVTLKNGFEPADVPPEQFAQFLRNDQVKWATWVKKVEPRLRKSS